MLTVCFFLLLFVTLFLTKQDEAESTERSGSSKLEVEGLGMCHESKLVFYGIPQNAFNILQGKANRNGKDRNTEENAGMSTPFVL